MVLAKELTFQLRPKGQKGTCHWKLLKEALVACEGPGGREGLDVAECCEKDGGMRGIGSC